MGDTKMHTIGSFYLCEACLEWLLRNLDYLLSDGGLEVLENLIDDKENL